MYRNEDTISVGKTSDIYKQYVVVNNFCQD